MDNFYKCLFKESPQIKFCGHFENQNNKLQILIDDASNSLKKYFKIEKYNIEGKSICDLLKINDLKNIHELLAKVRVLIESKKGIIQTQFEYDKEKWYYIILDYFDENYYVCSLYDITREYIYLEESENFFKLVPDLFCILNEEGVFLKVNPMWEKVTGYKEKQLLGKKLFEFVHPDEYEEVITKWIEFKDKSALNSFIVRYKFKSSKYHYLEWKVYQHNGKYYAGARDITRIIEKNQRLEKLAKFSNELFLAVDKPVDIKILMNNLLWLTNSKYCFLNIYNHNIGKYVTEHIGGDNRGINKLERIWGTTLLKKEWAYNVENLALSKHMLLPNRVFSSFNELPSEVIPKKIKQKLTTEFPIGNIAIYKIAFNDQLYGFIVFFTKEGEEFQHSNDLDIYIHQIGMMYRKLQAESALKTSENQLRQIIDLVPHLIFAKDYDGKFIIANKAVADLYGTTTNDIIGKTDADFNPVTVQVKKFLKDDREVMRSGKSKLIVNERIWSATGGNSILQTIKMPFRNPKTNQNSVLGVSSIITDLVNAENKLLVSEARYKNIIELAADTILLGTPEGAIVSANDQAEILTLFSKEELCEMNIESLFDDDELEKKPLRYDLLSKGKSVRSERLLKRKDGTKVHIEMNARRMPDNSLQSILRDIEEIKQIQNQLVQAKEKAEENDRLKSAFLSNMSHEIRTPMNAIVGFSSLLVDSELDNEKRQYYFDIIENNCNNLLRIIDDLLDISKVESGQIIIENSPCSINTILDRVYNILKDAASKQKPHLKINCQIPDEEILVLTDDTRLSQVLLNLVNNSLNYTDEGFISLKVEKRDNNLLFSVIDSGRGISDKVMPKIFERFYRSEKLNDSRHGGTGLGLTISKSLVEMMNGKIWIESELGKGTSVYVSIPIIKANEKNICNNNKFSPRYDFSKYSILVVEDDNNSLEFLLRVLQVNGFKNISYSVNGTDAVEKAKLNNYDIILMDIQIPGINGLEAAKMIKQSNQNRLNGQN